MAVKEDGVHYPTESIISKRGRRHYRIPVRSQHWQLRSLISAEKHIVYFPSGHGSNYIQRLNTRTHDCETIKILTFAPRCLVAEQGWLCCGSEHGEFVAIQLDDDDPTENLDLSLDLDRDARLGAFGLSQAEESLTNLLVRARRSNKSMAAKNVKLAKERVNCITLWFPPTQVVAHDLAYDFPVAVLANNDRTVTLVNLNEFEGSEKVEPVDLITFPDFVNRSIISPDGRILVSVLDDPYLYIHEREAKHTTSDTRLTTEKSTGWGQRQRIILKSQRKDDRSDSRGSFAACFSSSGAYLAVGTQHGTISIFNAALLSDINANPLIATFQSSRPQSGPGAVRDMAFCPGPFDILAWTEDRGHIGIADMRSNFAMRQIIDINVDSDFEHFSVLDRNTVDPRLLERRIERSEGTSVTATGSDPAPAGGRRIEAINYPPFSANELMVLEAMQGTRRNRERAAARAPGSDTPPPRPTAIRDPTQNLRSVGEGELPRTRERSSSMTRAIGELLGDYREQRVAHERVRSARQVARDASTTERPATTRRTDQRWVDRLGEIAPAIRDQRERGGDGSYLSVLELLQSRERETNENNNGEPRPMVLNPTFRRWEESAIRGTLPPDHGVFEVPPSPDNTSGLAWSDDGRTLFIGAQNGIYEVQVNVQSRKLCPSICPR